MKKEALSSSGYIQNLKKNKMKILILGGTGAMGTHLVHLLSKCHECFVTSRQNKIASQDNVHYIQGNAHNLVFLQQLLKHKWDVIVDFMIYNTSEFEDRVNLFLSSTKQYVFISSCRVYANCEEKITENSPRLVDVCSDSDYLSTDEYALTKGRQENFLFNSKSRNWTIIRPYITYSEYRLQLGPMEKEYWLYRALDGRSIIMPKDIASKKTTLTYGLDVAAGIVAIIGKSAALGEAFHITSPNSMTWDDILSIYVNNLKTIVQKDISIKYIDTWNKRLGGGTEQVKYDRLYNREFDNSKIGRFVDVYNFKNVTVGLHDCLNTFVNDKLFKKINYTSEAYKDKLCGNKISLCKIHSLKNKVKYFLVRYLNF